MPRPYQCSTCGNTSSVPMRCCGVPMRDKEERVAHIHADISREVCSGRLEQKPDRGRPFYRCPVCGEFELLEPSAQPGVPGREAGGPAD